MEKDSGMSLIFAALPMFAFFILILAMIVSGSISGKPESTNYSANGKWHAVGCNTMDCSVIISRYTFQDDILVVGGKEAVAVDIREVEKNRFAVLSEDPAWNSVLFKVVDSNTLVWETGPLEGIYTRQKEGSQLALAR